MRYKVNKLSLFPILWQMLKGREDFSKQTFSHSFHLAYTQRARWRSRLLPHKWWSLFWMHSLRVFAVKRFAMSSEDFSSFPFPSHRKIGKLSTTTIVKDATKAEGWGSNNISYKKPAHLICKFPGLKPPKAWGWMFPKQLLHTDFMVKFGLFRIVHKNIFVLALLKHV